MPFDTGNTRRLNAGASWLPVALLLIIGLVPRLIVSLDLTLHYFPDAIFQTLEPAHALLTGFGVKTWDWQEAIRWWGFPALLAVPMGAGMAVSDDPAVYLLVVRGFLACVSMLAPLSVYWLLTHVAGRWNAFAGALLMAIWYEPILFSTQALNEAFAAPFLVLAAVLATALRLRDSQRAFQDISPVTMSVTLGAVLAFIFFLRLHLSTALLLIALYAVWTQPRQRIPPLLLGALPVLLLGGAIDWYTWSYPFESAVNHIRVNLLLQEKLPFGSRPWWYYIIMPSGAWGLGFLLYGLLAYLGSRRMPIFLIAALVIFFTHSIPAHKEARFVFPAMLLAVASAGIYFASMLESISGARERQRLGLGIIALAIMLSLLQGYLLWSFPWHRIPQLLEQSLALNEDPFLCGVAFDNRIAVESGGHTYLNRHVPFIMHVAASEPLDPRINRVFAPTAQDYLAAAGFSASECAAVPHQMGALLRVETLCLWKREVVSCTTAE